MSAISVIIIGVGVLACAVLEQSTAATSSGKKINPAFLVGAGCTLNTGTRSYGGECRHLTDCPAAISNLHAGVTPTLCLKVGRVAVVCCPTQRSISELKCEEYTKRGSGQDDEENVAPLLPVESRRRKKSVDDEGVKDAVFIAGGEEAAQGEFPFMVALGYGEKREEGAWLCGGTLITDQYVLTAAHCLQNTFKGRLSRVLLGDVSLTEDEHSPRSRLEVNVASTLTHPNYTAGIKYNDIALVKLAHRVDVSKRTLRPACLPQARLALEKVKSSKDVVAAGWGLTEYLGEQSNILKYVGLTRYAQEECVDSFRRGNNEVQLPRGIVRSQFCAGEKAGEKDTCKGDSGGGMFVKKTFNSDVGEEVTFVVGITSFGSKYCGLGEPGVYTNVQSYLEWIESTVWP